MTDIERTADLDRPGPQDGPDTGPARDTNNRGDAGAAPDVRDAGSGDAGSGDGGSGDAARKRRRRGSRGGRNRKKRPADGTDAGAAARVGARGEDWTDAAADRGLTDEDVAQEAKEEAGIAPPVPSRPKIGDTRPAPAPAPAAPSGGRGGAGGGGAGASPAREGEA